MKIRLGQSRHLAAAYALLALVGSNVCHAETNATQKAAAEAAFQAGVDLMAHDRAAEACAKFESSQQMDPALGTMVRLADCYETVGRTASAWALFLEARSTAAVQGRPDRESIAADRAKSLEQRLSRLELHVEGKVPNEELKINGVSIPSGTWDAALPVDPGKQHIEVSAPGYNTWTTEVEALVGPSKLAVQIPKLVPLPPEATPAAPPAADSSIAVTPPVVENRSGSGMRTAAYVVGIVGIGGLAVGSVFAGQAYSKNQDSLKECRKSDPNACSEEGANLRSDARTAGTRATIALAAGGVLVGTSITLLVLAPSRKEASAAFQPRLRRVGWFGEGGLKLQGDF